MILDSILSFGGEAGDKGSEEELIFLIKTKRDINIIIISY